MLVLYIIILMFTNSINHLKKHIHSIFINRITIITLLISIIFAFNTLYFQSIGKGISIYSGLFQITVQSHTVEIFLLIVGTSILLGWPLLMARPGGAGQPFFLARPLASANAMAALWQGSDKKQAEGSVAKTNGASAEERLIAVEEPKSEISICAKSDQYSLIAIFSILGGSLLISSLDLLSMYLSIELQSFALYILATLNKEKLSATSAGLKYFLLGSLSSCLILLGSAIIYSYTGLTQFEAINTLLSISVQAPTNSALSAASISNTPFDLTLAALPWREPNPYGSEGTGFMEMLPLCNHINKAFSIGLIIILIGFLFKVSAAPFYQWAPDVYDGTPTIVTVWLTIVVKLTIFIFLLGLIEFTLPNTIPFVSEPALAPVGREAIHSISIGSIVPFSSGADMGAGVIGQAPKNLLLISSLLSLLIGTIAGLSQIKIKRLLAFSSISHVGFLLLALGVYTQNSVESFIFYLVQYSITSLNIFLIILALGYVATLAGSRFTNLDSASSASYPGLPLGNVQAPYPLRASEGSSVALAKWGAERRVQIENQEALDESDINYLIELKGQLYKNPVLSISFAICLFSMAGIPPLIGFFSKQFVLFSSIENGNHFLSIIAILVSVISASYYLRLIKIAFFETPAFAILEARVGGADAYLLNFKLTNFHSYTIAILTFLILFFFLDPSILLNGTQLISLTIFNL